MERALSVATKDVNRILIFNSEKALREALAENEHLCYLAGLDEIHSVNFPGVYLAGFKTSDSEGHSPWAIQKQ